MNRRGFLRMSSALAAAGLWIDPVEVAALQAGNGVVAPAGAPAWPAPFDSAPVLQNAGGDGVTVLAAVNAITTAWVEWGPTEALGQRADGMIHGLLPLSGRVHRMRLTGLTPGTTYWYRVVVCPIDFRGAYKIRRGEPVAGPAYCFRTLDPRGSTAAVNVINDTHENVETLAGLTTLMAERPADLTVWNGDIFNDVRDDHQIVANVMRPGGSAYAARTPMLFVNGNHDVRGIHARSLERFIDVAGGDRYGVVRHGPVAFIILDTGEDKADAHREYAGLGAFERYRDVQRTWLLNAVKDPMVKGAAFRVGVLHIPLVGDGSSPDAAAKWGDVLSDARVDLVINGHIHRHTYLEPDAGRPWGQLTGGGPAPETATLIQVKATKKLLTARVWDMKGKELREIALRR